MSELESFVSSLKVLEPYEVQSFLDAEYDGSCPCFEATKMIDGEALHIWGRCWRVSENAQDLYVFGTLDHAELEQVANVIKEKLDDQHWYNPYTIIYDWEP